MLIPGHANRLMWLRSIFCLFVFFACHAECGDNQAHESPNAWRAASRLIDLHQHLDYQPELLARAIRVMDAAGIGLGIDLTPGTVTPGPNSAPSEFEQHKKIEDTLFPGRW